MGMGRPMPPLILDDTERETLERWVSPQDGPGPGAAGQNDLASKVAATSQWLPTWRCPTKRWGSGVPGSWNGDWTACRTSPAAADRERLLMKTWNG